MTIALAALLAFLVVREGMHYLEARAVREERAHERSQWAAERSELLNRIKPETAQIPQALIEAEPESDEEYWDKVEGPFEEEPFGENVEQPWAETT